VPAISVTGPPEDLDYRQRSWLKMRLSCSTKNWFWRTMIADSCGALNVFVNVARIRSDAFWFSAVP
jgi:hypothetical protein